ncbi:MAG: HAD-IA family hydrolase [Gemmatimonadaceae bacterium]
MPDASPPRLPVVLFDLDGTLVDSIELILCSFRHACATELGRVPPDAEWLAGIGTPLVTQMRAFAESEAQLAALIAAYRDYQREHHDRLIRDYDGVRETLGELAARGHPMALVTSKADPLAVRALEFTGLRQYLPVIVGCDSCARHKPHPEPVLLALRLLGVEPADALFVGDSPYDIEAGNGAGVATVAALWGPFSREVLEHAGPTYVIAHIRELTAIVALASAGIAT